MADIVFLVNNQKRLRKNYNCSALFLHVGDNKPDSNDYLHLLWSNNYKYIQIINLSTFVDKSITPSKHNINYRP